MPAEIKFLVTVEAFRPTGGMNTTVTMTPLSPEGSKAVAELNGSYYIRVKKTPTGFGQDDAGEIKLTFVLATEAHRLLGIAFTKRKLLDKSDLNKHGQVDFPTVEIATVGRISQMTVTNMRTKGVDDGKGTSFDYAIYLQEIESGQIGIIDPEIVNEN